MAEESKKDGKVQPLRDEDAVEALPSIPPSRHTNHERITSSASESASSFTGSAVGSRTHVPSLTSRAFFAPMSSQRLQAQRSQRPTSEMRSRPSEDFEENQSATNRNSTGSFVTQMGPQGIPVTYNLDNLPPVSRDTDYTEWANAARPTATTGFDRSSISNKRQESLEQLQRRERPPSPLRANSHHNQDRFPAVAEPRDKSPSFMSGFKRSSRQSANGALPNGHTSGHSRLPSEPPAVAFEGKKVEVTKDLGRNYQYFTGKTIFLFGGRWQNARARPVVIVTGLLILAPSVLFFVFS